MIKSRSFGLLVPVGRCQSRSVTAGPAVRFEPAVVLAQLAVRAVRLVQAGLQALAVPLVQVELPVQVVHLLQPRSLTNLPLAQVQLLPGYGILETQLPEQPIHQRYNSRLHIIMETQAATQ